MYWLLKLFILQFLLFGAEFKSKVKVLKFKTVRLIMLIKLLTMIKKKLKYNIKLFNSLTKYL